MEYIDKSQSYRMHLWSRESEYFYNYLGRMCITYISYYLNVAYITSTYITWKEFKIGLLYIKCTSCIYLKNLHQSIAFHKILLFCAMVLVYICDKTFHATLLYILCKKFLLFFTSFLYTS